MANPEISRGPEKPEVTPGQTHESLAGLHGEVAQREIDRSPEKGKLDGAANEAKEKGKKRIKNPEDLVEFVNEKMAEIGEKIGLDPDSEVYAQITQGLFAWLGVDELMQVAQAQTPPKENKKTQTSEKNEGQSEAPSETTESTNYSVMDLIELSQAEGGLKYLQEQWPEVESLTEPKTGLESKPGILTLKNGDEYEITQVGDKLEARKGLDPAIEFKDINDLKAKVEAREKVS